MPTPQVTSSQTGVSDQHKVFYKLKKEQINKILKETYDKIDSQTIEAILNLLSKLFPEEKDDFLENSYSSRNIYYFLNFDMYFQYNLFDRISLRTFNQLRDKKDFTKFKENVNQWLDQNLSEELFIRLNKIEDYTSKEDYELIMQILFYLFSKPGIVHEGIVDFLAKKLNINKIKSLDITNKFYNGNQHVRQML